MREKPASRNDLPLFKEHPVELRALCGRVSNSLKQKSPNVYVIIRGSVNRSSIVTSPLCSGLTLRTSRRLSRIVQEIPLQFEGQSGSRDARFKEGQFTD